ncbi:MAG TPA: YggT family protein [Solirubrobacteraceae bacterium]|jgi:YggT family protein|nr:YggT family protein [Solirubrobacteraceae bacterium]
MTVLAVDRSDIANYVNAVFLVYSLIIIAYILVSLVLSLGGRPPYARAFDVVLTFLRDVSEPYLRIFRRFIPSMGGFDFSPILALIVLGLANRIIVSLIQG